MIRPSIVDRDGATPFLKWAGGKSQLLRNILPRLPERMRVYYEPFIGGGAVFFALANERRFQRAVIGDRNPMLVEAYQNVRDHVAELIDVLRSHADRSTDAEYFYEIRGVDVARLSSVERTGRLIFLNKTCFNGLFRVNRSGQFNVPFGRYKKPNVANAELLRRCSIALQGVEILEADFETIARRAEAKDAIYFDPPYVPLSATSSFTAYDRHPFGPTEHARLARAYRACLARGASAVLSNSDCTETRALYRGLAFETVAATRAINSVAERRGRVNELLVVGRRREGITSSLQGAADRRKDVALRSAARQKGLAGSRRGSRVG